MRALQKKIQQIENELDQVQESLTQATTKLEEKEKALQTVSHFVYSLLMSMVSAHPATESQSQGSHSRGTTFS